jgi:solute carrier family 35, member F1/2
MTLNSLTASNAALGDVLCLLGAFLYGVSNVAQEGTVKAFNLSEFLAMIGLFGTVFSGIQA